MIDINSVITSWIKKITTIQNSGHPICPYAKKAKYQVFTYEDYLSMQVKCLNFDKNFDLYICFPTDQWMSVEKAEYIEANLNKLSDDIIVLLDHWKNPGYIADVNTGNERGVVFLIQDKKGLEEARKHLHTTSYYNNWSKSYYNKITQTGFNKT